MEAFLDPLPASAIAFSACSEGISEKQYFEGLIMRTEMALLTLSIAGAIAATAGLLMATYLS